MCFISIKRYSAFNVPVPFPFRSLILNKKKRKILRNGNGYLIIDFLAKNGGGNGGGTVRKYLERNRDVKRTLINLGIC